MALNKDFNFGDSFLQGEILTNGVTLETPARAIMATSTGTVTVRLRGDSADRAIYMLAGVTYNLLVTSKVSGTPVVIGFW